MPAPARGLVLVSTLEPQTRDPGGRVEDRVVDIVSGTAGEQDRPERGDTFLVRGIESDLELGHDGGLGREPLPPGDFTDLLCHVNVLLCHPQAVLTGAP